MLDSLGMGEVFFLALLALIFFGPENLPRMGARLGKWIGSLTRTSRTFLTEWQEEALAVQEAVTQVRQIRDELYAARADITGTLYAARTDVDQALGAARADVNGQLAAVTAPLLAPTTATAARLPARTGGRSPAAAPTGSTPSPAIEAPAFTPAADRPPSAAGDGGAISRTQAILDQLARKRTITDPPLENLSPVRSPRGRGEGVEVPDLERLRVQVAEMTAQVAALRAELDAMRVRAPELAPVE